MNKDIIINPDNYNKDDYPIGWIPEKGQKIFIQCPNCGKLYEVHLGEDEILDETDGHCIRCGEYCGDYFYLNNIFNKRNIEYIVSEEKYAIEPLFSKNKKPNYDLLKKISSQIGQSYSEEDYMIVNEFRDLNFYKDFIKNDENYFIINSEDFLLISICKFLNIDFKKIFLIDKNLNIFSLKDIKFNVEKEKILKENDNNEC